VWLKKSARSCCIAIVGAQEALSQNCLFEAKSENRVLENQGLASPNFPVFGNLRQSPFLSKGYNALSGTREAAEEGYQVPRELRAVASTIFT
jgi:hypothetical protein